MWLPVLLVLIPQAAGTLDWNRLGLDIQAASSLYAPPGSTVTRDTSALIAMFNATAVKPQPGNDPANPYRGAFAPEGSEWLLLSGWDSIVRAHSKVAVRCRTLYLEGAEEFVRYHCYSSILSDAWPNGTARRVDPTPEWTVVSACCEELNRPIRHLRDAVYATTRGVGLAHRSLAAQAQSLGQEPIDDYRHVPALDCSRPVNAALRACDPVTNSLFTRTGKACTESDNCPKVGRPIGVTSTDFFNVGLAVGEGGMILRTLDGGHSWDCLRGCDSSAGLANLTSISTNVRLGGVGYEHAYYGTQAIPGELVEGMDGDSDSLTPRGAVAWTQLNLEESVQMGKGLDGVFWDTNPPVGQPMVLEGFAVGEGGTIIKIYDGGVTSYEPPSGDTDPWSAVEEDAYDSVDGQGCVTSRNINDVFFWNSHLAFFVGDTGFLCRYSVGFKSPHGPGYLLSLVIDDLQLEDMRWQNIGSDDTGLNLHPAISNSATRDYALASFRAVFCLQTGAIEIAASPLQWTAVAMECGNKATCTSSANPPISYTQHLTCFAVGTRPPGVATTSAILRYESRAVPDGTWAAGAVARYKEEVSWTAQNSDGSEPFNDIYCVKSPNSAQAAPWGKKYDALYCYAVGDSGKVVYTSNGGNSWQSTRAGSDHLRKVVVTGVTYAQTGYGASNGVAGDHAVAVGDNGAMWYTTNRATWRRLPRTTPEHIISLQFNAFDDFFYFLAGPNLAGNEFDNFDDASVSSMSLPFGNGIATASVTYDWGQLDGCLTDGNAGSPNTGPWTNRRYDCKKPEVSTILRTNCAGSLDTNHWRCREQCPDRNATVPVALAGNLASPSDYNAYFGYTRVSNNDATYTVIPAVARSDGTAALVATAACDEVWSVGHGGRWHEDTRTTRLYQSVRFDTIADSGPTGSGMPMNPLTNAPDEYFVFDTATMQPSAEICLYGWPRHAHQLHLRRAPFAVGDAASPGILAVPEREFAFLNRPKLSPAECAAVSGVCVPPEEVTWDTVCPSPAGDGCHCYARSAGYSQTDGTGHRAGCFHPDDAGFACAQVASSALRCCTDCIIKFGHLVSCSSWEVHGMGHSRDVQAAPTYTFIPFVNMTVVTDPCAEDWYGLTCEDNEAVPAHYAGADVNRTVTQLWLYSNNLQGAVPPSLQDLHSLRSLSLGANRLQGEIPADIWTNLRQLLYLSFASNDLVGTVPTTLCSLPSLQELKLQENSLSGEVPAAMGNLSWLLSLGLHDNQFSGTIPSQLGQLQSLQYLWLSSNSLSGPIPTQIGNLANLRFFWFANNSVTSLPAELGALAELRSLVGTNNRIADRIPYAFGNLAMLREMRLDRNQLRATLPDALGRCTNLVVLDLKHNQLVGPIPAAFGGLLQLTLLDLSYNLLERALPHSIGGMLMLQHLLLHNNRLEGGLPPDIGALQSLEEIDMSNNQLSLPLPDAIVGCKLLEGLRLHNNMIGGTLPSAVWRLRNLEYLIINNNSLRGPLPEGIGYLPRVRSLRLDRNQINGTLPDSIGEASTLEELRLEFNNLSGTLPSSLGSLAMARDINLNSNLLISGSIPAAISGLHSAVNLYLAHNRLDGQVPTEIGGMKKLVDLQLSHNRLAGQIPSTLGKLQYLVSLAVDHNSIGGSIPTELGDLSQSIQLLRLNDNQLGGLLPTFFRTEAFRTVDIDLANSPFWCPLPSWPSISSASCVHCPLDLFQNDQHRTCSDHGVCKDGACSCDPRWEGDDCSMLRCPNTLVVPCAEGDWKCSNSPLRFTNPCNGHGVCRNTKEPKPCTTGGNATDTTAGLCTRDDDDCVAAYHECPSNGISVQVDSTGVAISKMPKHDHIVFAKCECTDDWSGAGCTEEPPPPPTEEPWPDPSGDGALRLGGMPARRALVLAVTTAVVCLTKSREKSREMQRRRGRGIAVAGLLWLWVWQGAAGGGAWERGGGGR